LRAHNAFANCELVAKYSTSVARQYSTFAPAAVRSMCCALHTGELFNRTQAFHSHRLVSEYNSVGRPPAHTYPSGSGGKKVTDLKARKAHTASSDILTIRRLPSSRGSVGNSPGGGRLSHLARFISKPKETRRIEMRRTHLHILLSHGPSCLCCTRNVQRWRTRGCLCSTSKHLSQSRAACSFF
jgi:hypothetical protein